MVKSQNILASKFTKLEFGNIVFAMGSKLVKSVNNVLYLSTDLGETWNTGLSIAATVGNYIRYIYVFEDNKLLVCSSTKAYYSDDWVTIHQSSVLGIDGNAYVSPGDNFCAPQASNRKKIVINTVEMAVWGDYTINSTNEYVPNVWYTTDKGHTVKSAYKFGTTIPGGKTTALGARHIHNVAFNPSDNTFWIQTGDEPRTTYSHWIKGTYNTATDTWTWTWVGTGDKFKTGGIHFVGTYMYYNWDVANGGICRKLYANAAEDAHEQVLVTDNDCICVCVGERGDMLAIVNRFRAGIGDTYFARDMFYSPDAKSFIKVVGVAPPCWHMDGMTYINCQPPNAVGDIYTGTYPDDGKHPLTKVTMLPSINLTDILKNVGWKDAFKPLN